MSVEVPRCITRTSLPILPLTLLIHLPFPILELKRTRAPLGRWGIVT